MSTDDYSLIPDERLAELSDYLYGRSLDGEDVLDDLHEIAEVLRERAKGKNSPTLTRLPPPN